MKLVLRWPRWLTLTPTEVPTAEVDQLSMPTFLSSILITSPNCSFSPEVHASGDCGQPRQGFLDLKLPTTSRVFQRSHAKPGLY